MECPMQKGHKGSLARSSWWAGKEARPRWKPMKARNCLDESIRELSSIPMTCNVTGRDESREDPQS